MGSFIWGMAMKDFQLISSRTESEVRSKVRALRKQGWRIAIDKNGHEEGPTVCYQKRYHLGVVK
jgi:hypothetical protein